MTKCTWRCYCFVEKTGGAVCVHHSRVASRPWVFPSGILWTRISFILTGVCLGFDKIPLVNGYRMYQANVPKYSDSYKICQENSINCGV